MEDVPRDYQNSTNNEDALKTESKSMSGQEMARENRQKGNTKPAAYQKMPTTPCKETTEIRRPWRPDMRLIDKSLYRASTGKQRDRTECLKYLYYMSCLYCAP